MDKGGINDDIPISNQNIIEEKGEIQDTNETESGNTLAINDNQHMPTNEEEHVYLGGNNDINQLLRRSTRNCRPNIRYTEYIHAETLESKNGKEYHKNLLIDEDIGVRVLEYILTQHSLNKGLRMYGEQGEFATKKELKQLHHVEIFQPIDPDKLTNEEKEKAIASLMFLTEKQDGTIKARACADGCK